MVFIQAQVEQLLLLTHKGQPPAVVQCTVVLSEVLGSITAMSQHNSGCHSSGAVHCGGGAADDEDLEECVVCLERRCAVQLSPFGHAVLCAPCFGDVMRKSGACPMHVQGAGGGVLQHIDI